jgi:predicted RNA-binding Zn-ribbon protein involved in translation (DUF1610 family)
MYSEEFTKRMKRSLGFSLTFMGGSLFVIGTVLGILIELSGFFIMTGGGIIVLIIGMTLLRKTKGTSLIPNINPFFSNSKIRNCPDCGRSIPWDAIRCPYCSKEFQTVEQNPTIQQKVFNDASESTVKTHQKFCTACGSELEEGLKFCPNCGIAL